MPVRIRPLRKRHPSYRTFNWTDAQTVTVHVNNGGDPPTCVAARADRTELWPPNHKLVPVSVINIGAGHLPTTVTITEVRQDEPSNGLGDGDTACDAVISDGGDFVLLRAERSGLGNGRVYHINFTASNALGTCQGEVTVCVPHDQRKGSACVAKPSISATSRCVRPLHLSNILAAAGREISHRCILFR